MPLSIAIRRHLDEFEQPARDVGYAFLDAVISGDMKQANTVLLTAPHFGAFRRKELIKLLNWYVLYPREREWTPHGIQKTFRFWSKAEKKRYLEFANRVIAVIKEQITPDVCFGYGAVLAFARGQDMIPHDDDIDLIVSFPATRFSTFAAALAEVKVSLRKAHLLVNGEHASHRHILSKDKQTLDLFVGIEEDGFLSSFPGPRKKILHSDVFPPARHTVHGVTCPVPRLLEAYLANVYGESWRNPNPHFSHRWDKKAFAGLIDTE